MDAFAAFRRAAIACASLVMLTAAAQARADNPSDLLPPPVRVPASHAASTNAPSAPTNVAINLANAGTWLIGQQYTSGNTGAFPWTPGDAQPAPTNTQGATAEGLLRLYKLTGNAAVLNAAIANGQCQINNCISGWTYSDGSHSFATHDPLFLFELSQFSGDPQYANFANTNFWQRLTAGTYGGPTNNYTAAGWANHVLTTRTGQGYPELVAWDLSKAAVAAQEAGQTATAQAIMTVIQASINAADATHNTFDVIGLTGGIWASNVTGISLNATSGTWSGASNTAALAARLATFQAPGGGFVGSTSLAVSDANADVQTTGYAMLALASTDRALYVNALLNAGNYAASLQQGSGEIVEFTGATGTEAGSVESHGEALEAYADTIAGVDRWVAPAGLDSGDCSIQTSPCQTIAFAILQAGPGNTIHIASGTYDLLSNPALLVTKDGLTLKGEGATQPKIERTAGGANQALLVVNGARNVQVQNLEFDMDQTFIAEGVIANGFVDGLSISGNHFVQSRSNASQNSKYSWRNAISINDDNLSSQGPSLGIATGSNVSITNNTISGLADVTNGVFLRCGVDMDNGVGTISGNTITTGVHDIRVRFLTTTGASSGTATLIDGNTLNGRGLEFEFPNASAGAVTISNNHINALAGINGIANNYPADFSIMRLIGNPNGLPVAVNSNTFAGYQGSYRGVLVDNFPNTTFTGNTFTPANGVSDFVSLVVSNKALNTDNPPDAPLQMSITANGNTFNGSGVSGAGRAVEFLNDNANVAGPAATFGSLTFGTAASQNSFDGNLRWYFHLDDYNCETATTPCPSPPLPNYAGDIGNGTFPYGPNTDVRPFTGNVSAANNTFGGVAPSAMTTAQQNQLQAQTYDKGANPVLGEVDYGLTETQSLVYVNASYTGQTYGSALAFPFANPSGACAATTVYFGVNAFATISDGLMHVTNAGTVCVAKGNYAEAVNVAKNVQLIGDGNTAADTMIAGAVTINASGASAAAPLLLQNLRVTNTAVGGKGVAVGTASFLTFNGVAFAGNSDSGLDFGATSDTVVINNSLFDSNVGAGLRTATTAQVSNVSISGSTFSNNAAGIILFGASGSGNGQITNWMIDTSQFLSNDNANASSFGGGIWLKTGGAGSVINGFHVTNSTFADNGSSGTLNQVGITVRARPNTTMQDVKICDNTFSETATPGTQLTGINVFDDTASGGTYQPIVICGTTTLNNIGEGISGLEQFNSRGTKPLISLTGTLTLNNSDGFNDVRFSPTPNPVYVNKSLAGTPNGTVVSFSHPQLVGSPVSATFGMNAFATINDALASVQSGGTIYVDAGVYAESSGAGQNLVVGIPVTILGQEATVDARTRDVGGGGDASETIIVPGVEDGTLALGSLGNSAVVTVNSSNVKIDGVVIDGDNPALASGVNLNGANPDADSGMFVSGSNGTLQNIVFRNLGGSGIFACEDLSNCASPTAGGDNVISQNRFTNITNPSTWGIGVYAGDDFYAQINDNLFDQVRVGIQFAENDHLANTGAQPPQVQGNEIHATRIGLFFNLFYQSASTWTVANNHIFASANAGQTGEWRGIQVESMQSAQTATITGNIIDGSALLGQRNTVGYALNNWASSNSATTAIDGGSVSNADVGVLATDAMNYTGPVDGALIQNIAFSNIALGAIYVEDTNEQIGSAAVTIGSGNTYTSVAHQLVLAGAAPSVSYANGGSVDEVFVRAAGTFLYGTPSTGPCTSAACTTANASINAGIADVASGGTVDVEAGTFDENVVANKNVILHGPFNGVPGTDGSRGTNEAIISPSTGIALKVNANNVTFDGFTIQNVTDTAIASGGNYGGISDSVSIINNRVLHVSSGSGLYTNGPRNTPVTNWTVSNNLFDDIQSAVGSGINLWAVTGGTIAGNTVTNSAFGGIQVNGGNTVTISGNTITGTAHNGINIAQSSGVTVTGNTVTDANTSATTDEAGMTLYGGTANVTFACNSVAGSGTNGFSTAAAITDPFSGIKVFDNAITVNADVSHNLAQSIAIGSNWYGGGNATVAGSNAAGAHVADPLSANPIGNVACGDNTPTQIVLVSGSNQFALITNSFASPLVGRVQDALGGAVMGESMQFAPPASGASANLAMPNGLSNFNGLFSTTAIANSIAGPYAVMLADTNFGGITPVSFMLTNEAAQASITLDSSTLSSTYDGNPHAVTATTNPAGKSYTVTYNGSATAPTNAGTYNVVATINDPSYSGSTSGTLTIAPKPETLTLSNLSQVYDGSPKSVTVAVSPDATVAYSVTYNGSSTAPSAVGTYTVVATVTDPNYTGSATATLTITAASAPDVGVTISNGRSYVQYGKLVTYTIIVKNIGTADASSVAVDAVLPVTLINGNWTCVSDPGASCGSTSNGSGDLHATAVIPQTAVVIYTLTATVNGDQSLTTDQIAMTATVTVNGTPADSNTANNTATANTQIVIFRDGFEAGGDGAQVSAATTPVSSMSASTTLTLDPAAAPQGQLAPQAWLRGVDANGRTVFAVDTLHIGTLSLMRLSVSDANGNLVPGAWLNAQQFAFGFAGSGGKYQAMLAAGKSNMQVPLPAWAALPVQVFAAK